jgi:uncharacterized repeat protein (TIGR01451 family)
MDLVVINGPPTPPPGFEIERAAVPEHVAASATLPVPAYDWSYGCSATSAAMIAAYYDRTFYPNMYTGPANGGVMPMDNSIWGSGECPLSATHQWIDGRAIRGHVDDYWISYGSPGPDPWVGNWPEHTIGDCTGDYMETNKWFGNPIPWAPTSYFNNDGGTAFFFETSGAQTTPAMLTGWGVLGYDGGYGIQLFYESRGYTVDTMYNQYIVEYTGGPQGFTYDDYKAEIDAGRPVMIHVEGHTMVGVGYDDSITDTMYIHDTWDYNAHTMIWGDSYSGMPHEGVTIVQLQQYPDVSVVKRVVGGSDLVPGDPITFTLAIANSGGVVAANTVVTDVMPSEVLTPTFASTLAITETGVISYVWNVEPLGAGQSGVITIYGWISPSLESDFSFKNTASISDPEDNTPGNNTSSVTVGEQKVYLPLVLRNYPLPSGWVTVLSEDFEGSFPGSTWEVSDDDPDSGRYYWGKRDCRDNGGSFSAWSVGAGDTTLSCGSNYPNDVFAWMIYGPFSLADATAAELTFDWWSDTEYDYDIFLWGASTNGAEYYGTGATGDWSSWTTGELLDLGAVPILGNLLGEDQVWIAFVFSSDFSVTDRGSFVDNVLLRKLIGTRASGGERLASPHRSLQPNQTLEFVGLQLNQ